MEGYIQELLDAQWDALESRDKSVRGVRQELFDAIHELAEQRNEELSAIEKQVEKDRRFVEKENIYTAKRNDLEEQLAAEERSELNQSIKSLGTEIESLDNQIRELQIKRKSLDSERQRLASTYSSRTAKFVDAIADLDREHPQANASLVREASNRIQMEQQRKPGLASELEAATEGSQLWLQVCKELDGLDEELKGLRRDQLPQMAFLLSKTSATINKHLETASEAGWSALIIAIGHELQILHETQIAIQETVAKLNK